MKRDFIVIDIESVPQEPMDPEVLDYFQIHRWDKYEYDEKLIAVNKSIEPTLARAACIHMKTFLDNGSYTGCGTYSDTDESAMLTEFWTEYLEVQDAYQDTRALRHVTFNGMDFDFPFLELRSIILDIPFVTLPKKRFSTVQHFDVYQVLTNWGRFGLGNLDFWAHLFGFKRPKGIINSEEIAQCWQSGEIEKVLLKCENDVGLTTKMYQRMMGES